MRFRSDFERAIESPDELLTIGRHNLEQWRKLEAEGAELRERIESLLACILATALQEEAIKQYGNTDSGSIRRVLHGWLNKPDCQAFWDRLRKTTERGLLGFNLTDTQCQAVMNGIFDRLPQALVEVIDELTRPHRLLPRAEGRSVAMALSDLMRGERDAGGKQHS